MSRAIFVNLPVADLKRSMAFYEALGAKNNPQFTDDTAACMVFSDAIHVMLLTHSKWASFSKKTIPNAHAVSEVMLAITCESRDQVNAMADAAGKHRGVADINPKQDHGFMLNRSFEDPDGHIWEAVWMDMAGMTAAASSAHT